MINYNNYGVNDWNVQKTFNLNIITSQYCKLAVFKALINFKD